MNRYYCSRSVFTRHDCGCKTKMISPVTDALESAKEFAKLQYRVFERNTDVYKRIEQTIEIYDSASREILATINLIGGMDNA